MADVGSAGSTEGSAPALDDLRPEEALDAWVLGDRSWRPDDTFDSDTLEQVMEGASHPAEELSMHLTTEPPDGVLADDDLAEALEAGDEDAVAWEIALATDAGSDEVFESGGSRAMGRKPGGTP